MYNRSVKTKRFMAQQTRPSSSALFFKICEIKYYDFSMVRLGRIVLRITHNAYLRFAYIPHYKNHALASLVRYISQQTNSDPIQVVHRVHDTDIMPVSLCISHTAPSIVAQFAIQVHSAVRFFIRSVGDTSSTTWMVAAKRTCRISIQNRHNIAFNRVV